MTYAVTCVATYVETYGGNDDDGDDDGAHDDDAFHALHAFYSCYHVDAFEFAGLQTKIITPYI